MRYRRSQRSDREGSFPEPPCGMGNGDDSFSPSSRKNRIRNSWKALKCFPRWGRQGNGVNGKRSSNFMFSGLDVEDSWESGEDVDEFEVRTTSPPHSDACAFDVSQALQAVPEVVEEEEEGEDEEAEVNEVRERENNVDDVSQNSHDSKRSDYSSEFMTDDSTETSGLPWDSSFSQHDSLETPEDPEPNRIGIRPFSLPADLGQTLKGESNFIVAKKNPDNRAFIATSTAVSGADNGESSGSMDEWGVVHGRRPKATRSDKLESHLKESKVVALKTDTSENGRDEGCCTASSSSLADTLLTKTECVRKDIVGPKALSEEELKDNPHSNRRPLTSSSVDSTKTNSLEGINSGSGSRVKELMKKFGGPPNLSQSKERCGSSSPQRQTSSVQQSDSFDTPSSDGSSAESQTPRRGVPSEIIRHDIFRSSETKGFFWRSHPPLLSANPKILKDEELVDTSISTTEGNRSLDYSDMFSEEELQREYLASGEPTFIHI